jgi:xanthine dehydrogenase/oxidase
LPPKVYIDIGDVTDLKSYSTEPILTLGGNMSMSETIDLFNKIARKNSNYSYVKILADHIDLIASVPVRNVSKINCSSWYPILHLRGLIFAS